MSKLGTHGSGKEPLAIIFGKISSGVSPGVGARVQFDTNLFEDDDNSEMSLDIVTNKGRLTLAGGNVYVLVASVQTGFVSGGGPVSFQWRDFTGTAYVGLPSIMYAASLLGSTTDRALAWAVVKPSSSNDYELWLQAITGIGGNEANADSWMCAIKL